MDARVLLKKQYLDTNRTRENELISGNDWYSLEASRAVNQAIGRVIRHKDDFGAILLCDSRFQNPRQQSQLSAWIHGHLRENERNVAANFGTVVGEMVRFFRQMNKFDVPAKVRDVCAIKQEFDPYSNAIKSDPEASSSGLVTLYKRERQESNEARPSSAGTLSEVDQITRKKRKIVLVPNRAIKSEPAGGASENEPSFPTQEVDATRTDQMSSAISMKLEVDLMVDAASNGERVAPTNRVDLLREVKCSLNGDDYKTFLQAIAIYSRNHDIHHYIEQICDCFRAPHLLYLLKGREHFCFEIEESVK
uniref:ATP-dependent helicase C-terminal domain-containing protein n=1 Tax=Anopheles maculatus TaxID=74869 RepID=A0A182S6T0_9DIPT